jgi:hypothetical protein
MQQACSSQELLGTDAVNMILSCKQCCLSETCWFNQAGCCRGSAVLAVPVALLCWFASPCPHSGSSVSLDENMSLILPGPSIHMPCRLLFIQVTTSRYPPSPLIPPPHADAVHNINIRPNKFIDHHVATVRVCQDKTDATASVDRIACTRCARSHKRLGPQRLDRSVACVCNSATGPTPPASLDRTDCKTCGLRQDTDTHTNSLPVVGNWQ